MGVRGEIFSNRIILPNRTYFFNVKENRMGDLYLNIVESKNRENGGFDRQSVILFADDLQEFLRGFDESLRVMEKAVREKRQSGTVKSKPAGDFQKRKEKDNRPVQRQGFRDGNGNQDRRKKFYKEKEGHRSGERANYHETGKKRHVVIKKHKNTE